MHPHSSFGAVRASQMHQWWCLRKLFFDTNGVSEITIMVLYHNNFDSNIVSVKASTCIYIHLWRPANPFLVDESRQWPTPIPRMADGLIAWSRNSHRSCWTKTSRKCILSNTLALGPQVKLIGKNISKWSWCPNVWDVRNFFKYDGWRWWLSHGFLDSVQPCQLTTSAKMVPMVSATSNQNQVTTSWIRCTTEKLQEIPWITTFDRGIKKTALDKRSFNLTRTLTLQPSGAFVSGQKFEKQMHFQNQGS